MCIEFHFVCLSSRSFSADWTSRAQEKQHIRKDIFCTEQEKKHSFDESELIAEENKENMESFCSLFDPSSDGQTTDETDTETFSSDSECMDKRGVVSGNQHLPPEPEFGNVEYKLKLITPSKLRFDHLVTQLKWRLNEGNGEAIYEIGVTDSGRQKEKKAFVC